MILSGGELFPKAGADVTLLVENLIFDSPQPDALPVFVARHATFVVLSNLVNFPIELFWHNVKCLEESSDDECF